jgi:multiple sugar transport system substrate-binding protein
MRIEALVLAVALAMAPLSAQAADLVVWWEEGYSAQEDDAVGETIAAFEHDSNQQVELVFYPQEELSGKIEAALEAGHPPDFAFGTLVSLYIGEWAFDDRLVDLTDTVGHFSDMFDPDLLAFWTLLNQKTEHRALYALPMSRATNHIHVWKSLLEQAGFTLGDIPKEWAAFWSFWCDQVQPAVRRATGRDNIWGIGLNVSDKATEPTYHFFQFLAAYDADYVTGDGRLAIDDPEVRRRLIEAIDAYTAVYRKGCAPPGSIAWDFNRDNNQQFLAQAVVMTLNDTLSIPNALKHERPDDYYRNTATIEWPLGPDGEAFPIMGDPFAGAVFRYGPNVETAKEFVRFLVAEGWLAHYLDFAGERFLPPMPKAAGRPALARPD